MTYWIVRTTERLTDVFDCADGCEYSKFHRKRNESKNT